VVSIGTVDHHVSTVLRELGVETRQDAAAKAAAVLGRERSREPDRGRSCASDRPAIAATARPWVARDGVVTRAAFASTVEPPTATGGPDMTKSVLAAAAAAVMLLATALPATAAPGGPITPQSFCDSVYDTREDVFGPTTGYWVPIYYVFADFEGVDDLPILSREGCVTTVARGLTSLRQHGYVAATALSMPAALSQCEMLESFIEYPYAFYGEFVAHNRAHCAKILLGLHTDRLRPPAYG
jgi:hypothetical protein